mmetsp:Transcript_930/g.2168  ORF Transcript_930/g.2168 Transcript_930/m.2168 type:complete len:293 (+) Transcript_930:3161-4039(+)
MLHKDSGAVHRSESTGCNSRIVGVWNGNGLPNPPLKSDAFKFGNPLFVQRNLQSFLTLHVALTLVVRPLAESLNLGILVVLIRSSVTILGLESLELLKVRSPLISMLATLRRKDRDTIGVLNRTLIFLPTTLPLIVKVCQISHLSIGKLTPLPQGIQHSQLNLKTLVPSRVAWIKIKANLGKHLETLGIQFPLLLQSPLTFHPLAKLDSFRIQVLMLHTSTGTFGTTFKREGNTKVTTPCVEGLELFETMVPRFLVLLASSLLFGSFSVFVVGGAVLDLLECLGVDVGSLTG